MISVTIEQRIVVKFHVKLGKTATETYNLLKEVYGHECLSRARVFEWFKRFQDGREDVGDDSRPGRPSMSKTDDNIETIGNLVRSDRRLSIRAIGETVGIDKECAKRTKSWNDGGGQSTPQGRRELRIGTSRPRGGPKRILRPLEFARTCDTGMISFPRLAEPRSHAPIRRDKAPRGDNEPCVRLGGLAPGTVLWPAWRKHVRGHRA
ncbi:GVQW3 protein, partial [Acromyrmex insinuator]